MVGDAAMLSLHVIVIAVLVLASLVLPFRFRIRLPVCGSSLLLSMFSAIL